MPDCGFSFFLWMTVGFTLMYVLVLSALTAQPKNHPVIVTTVRDIHRRKRKRSLLVANAATSTDTLQQPHESTPLTDLQSGDHAERKL